MNFLYPNFWHSLAKGAKPAAKFFLLIIFLSVISSPSGCSQKKGQPQIPVFSGQRAFELLKVQCDFGPRPPKSSAHDSLLVWFVSFLDTLADTVFLQHFSELDYDGKIMPMANVIARFNPKADYRILLCAHWDTRPRADRDPDSLNRDKPILGANDGASGVAILLHIAEILKKSPTPVGVDIVFFDGEDFGKEGDLSHYLMGSKYFARNAGKLFWKFAVLLDMVGDADLHLPKEQYSAMQSAPDVVDTVWNRAKSLGLAAFENTLGKAVIDDHLPLAEAGIKAIDIIDFDYKYWHTLQDTPDKCSAQSLEQVGKLLVDLIYRPVNFK